MISRHVSYLVAIAAVCSACSLDTSALLPVPSDSGVRGTGDCSTRAEECNGEDDDCDELVDEDFDLETDPDHCGACGVSCSTAASPNGAHGCLAGACTLLCDEGFADCDAMTDNGCETSLGDAGSCGNCTQECWPEAPVCELTAMSYSCVSSCSGSNVLCDSSCVDTSTSVSHCGACGAECPMGVTATRNCAASTCGYLCTSPFFDDCDGAATAGCEQSLRTVDHCGTCDRPCTIAHGTGDCGTGTCRLASCDTGRGNCDADAANGCETNLTYDSANCGFCGNACVGSSCVSGVCEEACNGLDDDGDGAIDEGTDLCPCPVEQYAGHAYMFCTGALIWENARGVCTASGYHLLRPETSAENDELAMRADGHSTAFWWIGVQDRMSEGDYRWDDETSITTTFWDSGDGQPDNAGDAEDCVNIGGRHDERWNDLPCSSAQSFICEAP